MIRSRPAALVLAVMVGCLLPACRGSGGSPSASASPQRARILYRVTGNAPQVTIQFGNRRHSRRMQAGLPWEHLGSAFEGTTVMLRADQPKSRYGYRLSCTLSITIPGHRALLSRDSSHIVGIKPEGGPQRVLYDGTCNTSQVVSLTGL